MPLRNAANTLRFFVQDTTTGKGVSGLTVAGPDFTSIKLSQDGTPSADIKGSIALVDEGTGWYNFAITQAQAKFKCIAAVVAPANADYQAYGVTMYTMPAGPKHEISADGKIVKCYDAAGVLLVTLTRSASAPYVWTPVEA